MKQKTIMIGNKSIGSEYPMYTIAEIGSNFDGSIERAKKLVDLAVDYCGADAVKFQSFKATDIVSKIGFLGRSDGFQSHWEKPVYEVYKDAEFPREWHQELFNYCKEKGSTFLSAPYDREAVDLLDELGVEAFKVGSGDITWLEMLEYIAHKDKPIILATGASTLSEVDAAVKTIKATGNKKLILLQCVTNYPSTFESANVNAMKAMGKMFDVEVGYSDHTPGSIVPLCARALGGCIIEKHFTDDKTRKGPDHSFAMDHHDFKEMVEDIRCLEKTLGSPHKTLYEEEAVTVDLQRRCVRAADNLGAGLILEAKHLVALRPAPEGTICPKYCSKLIGKKIKKSIARGAAIVWEDI